MKWNDREVIIKGRLVKIGRLDSDKYDAVVSPETVVDALRNSNRRIDLFTFMQIMPDTEPRFGYHREMDNLAVLPVSTYENWWNNQIRSYPRNRARQAEKRGVILKEVSFDDAFVEGVWEVYNETKVRQGRPNSHYGKDVETVRREAATFLDRAVFIGAYFEDKLIGFVKLVIDESGTQAGLMNIVAMIRHRDKAPSNALIAHAVRACASRSIPYLMYQSFSYGNKGSDSIAHFKEINGFKQIDLPRYYVPLTPLGKMALRYGFHRRLMDQLPEGVAEKLRQIRNSWYNRKLHSEAEAS